MRIQHIEMVRVEIHILDELFDTACTRDCQGLCRIVISTERSAKQIADLELHSHAQAHRSSADTVKHLTADRNVLIKLVRVKLAGNDACHYLCT